MSKKLFSYKKFSLVFLSVFVLLFNCVVFAGEKGKTIWGVSINKLPVKGSGTTTGHYNDGWDDYYPKISLNINNPLGLEVFAIMPMEKLDGNARIFYSKANDVDVLSIGLGAQTKAIVEGKSKPYFGGRLTYTRVSGKSGTVPLGNNTGLDFMLAPDGTVIDTGTDFKASLTAYGLEAFVGYLVPLGKQGLYLEGGWSQYLKQGNPKMSAGGKDIPVNFSSKSLLESGTYYFKIGMAFGSK